MLVVFSAGGLAPAWGLRPAALRSVGAMVATASPPRVTLDPFPAAGRRGEVAGGRARIVETAGGAEVAAVEQLAAPPSTGLRPRRWDDLEVLRLAALAVWRDVALPFVLTDPSVGVRELPPRSTAAGRRHRLEVTFPREWAVGPGPLVVHVDRELRIRSQEYRLDLLGRPVAVWETSAGHCDFDGLVVATRRRAYPRVGDGPAPGPRLWWVDVLTAMAGPRPRGSGASPAG